MRGALGPFGVAECGTSNWTGGWCEKQTRWVCPWCFARVCGTHKYGHVGWGLRRVCGLQSFDAWGGRSHLDHDLVTAGLDRALADGVLVKHRSGLYLPEVV